MMAMTPYEKKTLDEIEHAFLDVIAPRVSPSIKLKPKPTPPRRGWFSGFKDKMVSTFVCCAPPQMLLDDDEIHEILAKVEEPVKPVRALPPRVPSRKDSLLRRNSASVMPASRPVEKPTLSDITHDLERCPVDVNVPETEEPNNDMSPRAHVKLTTMKRVIVTLLALHKTIETRQTERAVLAVQMKWRRRQPAAIKPTVVASPVPPHTPTTPTTPTTLTTPRNTCEPDLEPKTIDEPTVTLASPKRRRHRVRKARVNKKTKFEFIPSAAKQEVTEAVESITQLTVARKRLRSVDLESCSPSVDVERNVHVLFGVEEIDEDDDEVLELQKAFPPHGLPQLLRRCASVPPPSTASRPRPIKAKSLLESQAASTIQRVWRNVKGRREQEFQRRQVVYEMEKQSVMPTIRDKMTLLRKRLAEMQERHSEVIVVAEAPVIAPADDDYDWL